MAYWELFNVDMLVDSAGQPRLWLVVAMMTIVPLIVTIVVQRFIHKRSLELVRADMLQLAARVATLETREQARFLHSLNSSTPVRSDKSQNHPREARTK
jgi:hypothetical protein